MSIATALASGLQLKSPLEKCRMFEVVAPSPGYNAGDIVKIEDVVGVVYADAATGDTAVIIYKAPKIRLACAAAVTAGFAVGEKVYADIADNQINESSSGNTLCGVVLEASDVGDTSVLCELDGTLGLVA